MNIGNVPGLMPGTLPSSLMTNASMKLMSTKPSGPHIENSGSKMLAGNDKPEAAGTFTNTVGITCNGARRTWYEDLSISVQKLERWDASVYCVVPTSVPPK